MSIVGPDGAGKSTVSKQVFDRLVSDGSEADRVDRWDIVGSVDYPATRFMKDDVPDARQCVAEMPRMSRFLFLMWSISFALLAKPTIDRASTVVLDGYWMKHAASEVVYGLEREWVESVVGGLPASSRTYYLKIDPEIAWSRKVGRDVVPYECGMDETCSRESFIAHQSSIRDVLDLWAARWGWTVIEADRPVEELTDCIAKSVRASGLSEKS